MLENFTKIIEKIKGVLVMYQIKLNKTKNDLKPQFTYQIPKYDDAKISRQKFSINV